MKTLLLFFSGILIASAQIVTYPGGGNSAQSTAASSVPLAVGGATVNGSITTIRLSTPSAPTVTPSGTAGGTNYSYKIVAKQADGSFTAASSAGSTSTGNVTLSATNYNALSWTAVPNAANYDVYRTAGGATQGKLTSVTTNSYNDQGATGDTSTAPTVNITGNINAPIVQASTLYSAAGTALPTCNTSTKGQMAVVSDATSPTYLAAYTSGGAVVAPVLCNGSSWVTH